MGRLRQKTSMGSNRTRSISLAIMYVSKGNAKHVLGEITVNAHATF